MAIPFDELRRRALRGAAAAAGLSALSCSQPASTNGISSDAIADADVQSTSGADANGDASDAASGVDSAGTTGNPDVADSVSGADANGADSSASDVAGGSEVSADASVADASDAQGGDLGADISADTADCKDFEPEIPACLDISAPNWSECCQERAVLCGEKYPKDNQAAQTCTYGDNFSGQCSGCIPWGPPAPPAFDTAWQPHIVANGEVFVVV